MQPVEASTGGRLRSTPRTQRPRGLASDRCWFLVDWDCCLGAGGEGEVFLGRSVESGQLCAVKVSAFTDRAAACQQLSQELDRLWRASGSGVVGLVAWNLQAERPFLVFELAQAGTLADEMRSVRRETGTYHPLRALRRIREVLEALSRVHARGLVHCDVKPANLLRFGDTIKLADFGAGHSLGPAAAFHLDTFVGTRRYASPEQIQGADIDRRTDLYSVGCILHEMLTGEAPEAPLSSAAEPRYPSALVLPELDALLGALLAGDKTARPADTLEAIDRVDLALRSYESVRRLWTRLGLGPSPY